MMTLLIGGVVLTCTPASAQGRNDQTFTSGSVQDRCISFGGTVYGWHTDNWYATGNFVVGRKVRQASIVDVNTGFFDNGGVSTGTEIARFDFGKGDTFQMNVDFVAEHMNNDALTSFGVFDVKENGTFSKGTGIFKGAYGHWIMEGPFGPNLKLPDNIHPAPNSDMFWIGWYHGMICGVE